MDHDSKRALPVDADAMAEMQTLIKLTNNAFFSNAAFGPTTADSLAAAQAFCAAVKAADPYYGNSASVTARPRLDDTGAGVYLGQKVFTLSNLLPAGAIIEQPWNGGQYIPFPF